MGFFGRLFGTGADEDPESPVTDDDEYDDDDGDDDDGQGVDVHSAADIYFSAGMDEDQMFGYSHDELQKAFDS